MTTRDDERLPGGVEGCGHPLCEPLHLRVVGGDGPLPKHILRDAGHRGNAGTALDGLQAGPSVGQGVRRGDHYHVGGRHGSCYVFGRFLTISLSGKHNRQRGFGTELGSRLEECFSYPTSVRVGDNQELLTLFEGQR